MEKERQYFIYGQVDEDGNVLVPGCVRNGIDEKSANKIFDEMSEFAKYAFNKSHAACYAVVSYRTAFLKAYYPEEFMAAMLNSFLGNLDKIPIYIDECKNLNIEILKPDINKSYTKFTVDNGKIRFGLGSIKNVGIAVIDNIVKEREENGAFENFTSFCERMQNGGLNKKSLESLIKAGAFDEFEQTRATLMESFEGILDIIQSANKKSFEGQVSMFDLGGDNNDDVNEFKYKFTQKEEYQEKELLSMEKEMLGLYISGHPLENMRHAIEMQTNINSIKLKEINSEENTDFKDGQNVKIVGIISQIKKKFTKNNTIMAFVTIDDLYGSVEIIVFDSCYHNSQNILVEEMPVLIEGRLSIREDEAPKIVANRISEFGNQNKDERKKMFIDITSLNEDNKAKLRGMIKFFTGDRRNIGVEIIDGKKNMACGAIYLTEEILKEFKELMGEERVYLK